MAYKAFRYLLTNIFLTSMYYQSVEIRSACPLKLKPKLKQFKGIITTSIYEREIYTIYVDFFLLSFAS